MIVIRAIKPLGKIFWIQKRSLFFSEIQSVEVGFHVQPNPPTHCNSEPVDGLKMKPNCSGQRVPMDSLCNLLRCFHKSNSKPANLFKCRSELALNMFAIRIFMENSLMLPQWPAFVFIEWALKRPDGPWWWSRQGCCADLFFSFSFHLFVHFFLSRLGLICRSFLLLFLFIRFWTFMEAVMIYSSFFFFQLTVYL